MSTNNDKILEGLRKQKAEDDKLKEQAAAAATNTEGQDALETSKQEVETKPEVKSQDKVTFRVYKSNLKNFTQMFGNGTTANFFNHVCYVPEKAKSQKLIDALEEAVEEYPELGIEKGDPETVDAYPQELQAFRREAEIALFLKERQAKQAAVIAPQQTFAGVSSAGDTNGKSGSLASPRFQNVDPETVARIQKTVGGQ